jgi:hypothetical protein
MVSALGCKYAVTGSQDRRKKAEDAMEKSRLLSQASPEAMKGYEEYAERIRYRLDSGKLSTGPSTITDSAQPRRNLQTDRGDACFSFRAL